MMTEFQAWQKAKQRARKEKRDFYVCYDREDKTHFVADESYIEMYGWQHFIKGWADSAGYCY